MQLDRSCRTCPPMLASALLTLAGATTAPPAQAQGDAAEPATRWQVSRYSERLEQPGAAQLDPLQARVRVHFPRERVHSVGDALHYLLLRSGHRLAPTEQAPAAVRELLSLPLPEVHRVLGPYRLDHLLSVLLGPSVAVEVDSARRELTLRARAAPRSTIPPGPLAAGAVGGVRIDPPVQRVEADDGAR